MERRLRYPVLATFATSLRRSFHRASEILLCRRKTQRLSMEASNSFREWSVNLHNNHDHLLSALHVLTERERTRGRARLSSCNPPNHSLPVHLPHAPPSVLGISDSLIEYYSTVKGCQLESRSCNRYADILPYDRTRITINNRYFNGDWVRERAGGHWFIATQAPLPETAHEFLSILADLDPSVRPPGQDSPHVRTVVQLTQDVESGRRKAHVYFPSSAGESWVVRPD